MLWCRWLKRVMPSVCVLQEVTATGYISLIIHILSRSFNWNEEGSQNYEIQIPNKPYGLD